MQQLILAAIASQTGCALVATAANFQGDLGDIDKLARTQRDRPLAWLILLKYRTDIGRIGRTHNVHDRFNLIVANFGGLVVLNDDVD